MRLAEEMEAPTARAASGEPVGQRRARTRSGRAVRRRSGRMGPCCEHRRAARAGAARPPRRRRRCSTATRSPTSSSPPGCAPSGLDPWRLGGEVWGHERRRPARVALPRRRQPRAGRAGTEAARAPSPTGPAGQGRRCSSIVGPADDGAAAVGAARAGLGTGPRGARAPAAAWPSTAPPLVPADPLVRRVRPHELDVAAAGLRRDVHRGGRRLAGRRRRRRGLPRPGRRADRAGAGRSPGSRTAGWCSRPRSAR